jgi:hypothetical protein
MKARELIDSASYGPDQLKILGKAFDDAWAQIAPHVSGKPSGVEAARLKLAQIVLNFAKGGVADAQRLTDAAVEAMFDGPTKLQP